ncbi:MAG: UDP-N-acetylmuramate dehydrogenase, partial [bacterium]|nr:UDP-N-acetylmuramate dehydrogenase [bacterium]
MKIEKNKILAPMTSFKIGGIAKFFIEVKNAEEIKEAIAWAKMKKEKIIFFAGGSNVLINDAKINCLVIKLSNTSLLINNNELVCGAGLSLARAVKTTIDHNLTGLEWAIGIPGTVGGAIYGNAGAFDKNMATIVKTIVAYNIKNNIFSTFSNKQCCFDYRDSIFKQTSNLIITKIHLTLTNESPKKIKELINKYILYRNTTQPKGFSAGSIFKNLTFDYVNSVNQDLALQAKKAGIINNNKIATSWIIDKLGLKNKQIGDAKISEKHAGFILNIDKAKAKDVIDLINFIKQQTQKKYNIK